MTARTEPLALVGHIVEDQITRQGLSYVEAARRWHVSLATVTRLRSGVKISDRYYAVAEKNLGLPDRLLSYVLAGDTRSIRDLPGLDGTLRTFILRELGEDPPVGATRRKRA